MFAVRLDKREIKDEYDLYLYKEYTCNDILRNHIRWIHVSLIQLVTKKWIQGNIVRMQVKIFWTIRVIFRFLNFTQNERNSIYIHGNRKRQLQNSSSASTCSLFKPCFQTVVSRISTSVWRDPCYDTCKTREVVINQTINCEFRRVQGYDRSKDEAHLASKERRVDLGESR